MISRFNFRPVLRGHWKGLSNGARDGHHPDWLARIILATPAGLFVVIWGLKGSFAAPTPILAAVALLAGGMLTAFTHLSTLRMKITELVDEAEDERFVVEREMIDET